MAWNCMGTKVGHQSRYWSILVAAKHPVSARVPNHHITGTRMGFKVSIIYMCKLINILKRRLKFPNEKLDSHTSLKVFGLLLMQRKPVSFLDTPTCLQCDCACYISLLWRHNGGECVSNHQPFDRVLNRLFALIKENIKAPRHWPLCGEFTWPVTRKMFPFDDVIMYSFVTKSIYWSTWSSQLFNTLRSGQDERHFADDIFKCIFLNENVRIPIKTSLKFVPKGSINNIPVLVQIMAWCRPGDQPLSEPMMVRLPTHICVTRPQWVK